MTRARAVVLMVAVGCGVALALFAPGGRMTSAPPATSKPQAPAVGVTRVPAVAPRSYQVTEIPAVPEDPLGPDYDPVRLSDVTGLSAADLFEREPRVDAWAAEMEDFMTPRFNSDLRAEFPDLPDVTLQCRASSCVAEGQVPEDIADAVYAYWQRRIPMGTTVEPRLSGRHEDGSRTITMHILLAPRWRVPAQYREWFGRGRAVSRAAAKDSNEVP